MKMPLELSASNSSSYLDNTLSWQKTLAPYSPNTLMCMLWRAVSVALQWVGGLNRAPSSQAITIVPRSARTSIKRNKKRRKNSKSRKREQLKPTAGPKLPKLDKALGERAVVVEGDATHAIFATGDNTVINMGGAENQDSNATTQQGFQRTEENFDEIRRKLDELREPIEVSELRGKVELIGSLYSRGKLGLALEEGESLRETVPVVAPPNLKHRLFAILSSAKLRLGKADEAVTDSETSLKDEPENLVLLENAANTNLIAGNLPRAVELARSALAHENSAAAMSVLVQATFSEMGRKAVSQLIEQNAWATDEQLVHTALAVTYMQKENYSEAEMWLRRDPPQQLTEPHEAEHITFLAELLIEQTQKNFARALPLPWSIAPEDLKRLTEAIELTSKVIEFWTGKEPVSKLGRALAERATARLLSNQSRIALDDLDAAAALGVEDDLSRLTRIRILLDLDQSEKVVELVKKIPLDQRIRGYDGLLAVALYRLRQLDEALEATERELSKAVTTNERLSSLELLLDLYGKQKDTENAERVGALVQAEGSHRATSVACLAAYRYGQGDNNEAHKLFRQALELPEGTSLIHFEYAEILAGEGLWSKAADLIGPLMNLEAQPSAIRRYAIWLFNAQRFPEALEYTTSVRERYGVQVVVTAIEADLRHKASDFATTVPLLTELEKLEPGEERHRLTLLSAYVGLGDVASARGVVNCLDAAKLRSQPHDLMWLAQTSQALGMAGATELAWEAQRAAPSDHDLFTAYFRIFLNDNEVKTEVDEVAIDTTATLIYPSGNTSTITLLDRNDTGHGELNLRSDAAQKLIGRRVREKVQWGQTSAGPTFVQVEKVRHKYVARFQDTNPNDLPSDQPTLELFRVTKEEVPKEILDRLEQNAQMSDRVFEAYAKSRIWPLHAVASLLQTSFPTTRLTLRLRYSGKLKAFDGSPIYAWDTPDHLGLQRPKLMPIDELRRQRVAKTKRTVIDDSALLTLAELDLLSLLEKCFEEVIVPQTVVNTFDTEIAQITGLLMPPELPANLAAVGRARRWVREHAKLVPTYARLAAPTERLTKFGEILPHHVIDALITAEEMALPLFTDDAGLCNLFVSSWKIRPTNTRHLLDHALEHGHISLLEQAKQLARLAEFKYSFVPFSTSHLIALFDEEGLSPSFEQLLTELGASETSDSSAFGVAINFFDYLVFAHPQSAGIRNRATRDVLDALSVERKPEDVADVFRKGFLREPGGQILSLYAFHKCLESWLQEKRQKP